jgi:hypothetical protein
LAQRRETIFCLSRSRHDSLPPTATRNTNKVLNTNKEERDACLQYSTRVGRTPISVVLYSAAAAAAAVIRIPPVLQDNKGPNSHVYTVVTWLQASPSQVSPLHQGTDKLVFSQASPKRRSRKIELVDVGGLHQRPTLQPQCGVDGGGGRCRAAPRRLGACERRRRWRPRRWRWRWCSGTEAGRCHARL